MTRWLNKHTLGGLIALVAAAVVLIVFAMLTGGNPSATTVHGQTPSPSVSEPTRTLRVKAVRPVKEHLKRTTTQPAHVEPYEKTDLYARVAGYVGMVHVDIGDRVKKDQVLAELSIPEMDQEFQQREAAVAKSQAELEQAEANLQAAAALVDASQARVEQSRSDLGRYEAELAFRRGEYDRYLQLFKGNSVQKELVDEKLNQYRAAEASLAAGKAAVRTAEANTKLEQAKLARAQADITSARAQVKVAEANREHTRILVGYGKVRAPYDGIVTRRLVDRGAYVQSPAGGKSEPLLTVVRSDRLRIVTDIPEAESSWIKIGQMAGLQVDSLRGQQFPGKIARIADALSTGTRTMRVEIELNEPADRLRPGMFGAVTITLVDQREALLLPAAALQPGNGRPFVWSVEKGVARKRPLVIDANDGIRFRVVQGLTGNEPIITEGNNLVQEGQAVEIAP
jgi:RND family efflux transporter MFP subunit